MRRFVERHVVDDGRRSLVALALSGAHAYGFPSPDSDLDLKAIHLVPIRALVGLRGPPTPPEHTEIFEGREMDCSSHELGQAAQLLLKGNGNMLERVLARLPLVDTPLLEQLRVTTARNLSRRVHHHYRGFLHQVVKELEQEAAAAVRKAKRFLYAYRVALTGVHALLEGDIEPDVRVLAPRYGLAAEVDTLIVCKQSAELALLTEDAARPYQARLPRLFDLLDDAAAGSPLPESPAHADEMEQLVIDARLRC
ncbi:MAG: hypothetical protein A2138_08120 [Deltaproteobacteria bacterium RBG_16_71_12]|nr:MAG: hypothetical protein A2138_08120 [Deltaproteobacteria bacterium RBG_16_71_12]